MEGLGNHATLSCCGRHQVVQRSVQWCSRLKPLWTKSAARVSAHCDRPCASKHGHKCQASHLSSRTLSPRGRACRQVLPARRKTATLERIILNACASRWPAQASCHMLYNPSNACHFV
jgi:hypothetical protein